jgi:hypothetical protein
MFKVARDHLCPDGVKIAEKFDSDLIQKRRRVYVWDEVSNYLRVHFMACEDCHRMQKS